MVDASCSFVTTAYSGPQRRSSSSGRPHNGRARVTPVAHFFESGGAGGEAGAREPRAGAARAAGGGGGGGARGRAWSQPTSPFLLRVVEHRAPVVF